MNDFHNKLIIIGASGHGKVIADIARLSGYKSISFLDDDCTKIDCLGYPIIGEVCNFIKYCDYDFIVAVGNSTIREKIFNELLSNSCKVVTLIHPNAVVGMNIDIGCGTVIMAGAVVNPGTRIGAGCIINTGSTVDHDNCIGDFSHISVGAHLAGSVTIGKHTWIGAGAIVNNNISISENCVIGSGTVVVKNIEESGTYVGVPASKIR